MTAGPGVIAAAVLRDDTSGKLVLGMVLFGLAAFAIGFGALVLGRILRPTATQADKRSIYECGEPAIGKGWVQFDLRFYVVALVFIVFDVEIALFWPWAVVFGSGSASPADAAQIKPVALWDMLFFFGVIVVGFLYLWRYGYLQWVRGTHSERELSR